MGMALDEPVEDEKPISVNGIDVLIEEFALSLSDGTTLDYVTLPDGEEGFTITGAGDSCGDSCSGGSCSC